MDEYGEMIDDDTDYVYTAFSSDAQEAFDAYSVEWVCQDDGSYVPWQWYEREHGNWDCYLARDWTNNDEESDGEGRKIDELADIYITMHREVAKDLDSLPTESYVDKLRETFVADTTLKRSFGKSGRAKSAGLGVNRNRVGEKR